MEKSKPGVSVIMAAFNVEKYIDEAIESILKQTYTNFELIIVDDCSSDSTLTIAQRHAETDKRIKVIRNSVNVGAAASRNIGIKSGQGEFVAIFDADDVSVESRLYTQTRYLNSNSDIFLVSGSYLFIDKMGNVLNTVIDNIDFERLKTVLPKSNVIHNPTVMFRAGSYLYREKFFAGEDYDLWLRMLSDGRKMIVMPDIAIKYRLHGDSITQRNNRKLVAFVRVAQKYFFQRIRTGFDDYDALEMPSFKEDISCNQNSVSIQEIKFLFKNKKMTEFRSRLFSFYSQNGIFSWKVGGVYYALSFFPGRIQDVVIKLIWH